MFLNVYRRLAYFAEDMVLNRKYRKNSQVKQKHQTSHTQYVPQRALPSKSYQRKFWFQKAAICIAGVLWLITAARVLWLPESENAYDTVMSAFGNNVYTGITADMKAYGLYGNLEVSDSAKEIILERLAKRLGADKYEISDSIQEQAYVKHLYQTGKNGEVHVKFITLEKETSGEKLGQQQYISVEVKLLNSMERAFSYEKVITQAMKELQIDCDVSLKIEGMLPGVYAQEDKQQIAENLLKETGAKKKIERQTDDVYMVYAYDDKYDRYYKIGSDKVNVNVAITYDEVKDMTMVDYATPMNNDIY